MTRIPLFILGSLLAIVVCCSNGVAQNITWTIQHLPETDLMWQVKAVDLSVAWAVGDHGNVFRTTDGGTTWTSVGIDLRLAHRSTVSLEAVSATTAFVCGVNWADMKDPVPPNDTTFLWRTNDGGGTWSVVYAQPHGYVDAVKMISPTEGIGMGDPAKGEGRWTIIRTTDSGTTWSRIPSEPPQINGELGLNRSLCTYGTNNIWFGTWCGNNSSAAVYRSTDAGLTWSRKNTSFQYDAMTVWFSDSLHGLCSETSLARSTDGGVTWIPIRHDTLGLAGWDWQSYENAFITLASVSGAKDLWATLDTIVYRSTDWGASWSIAYANANDTLFYGSFATVGDSTVGYFTTLGANMVTCRFREKPEGVHESAQEDVPTEFGLSQNYPNPFNPSTTIRYELPHASRVSLKVYNVLGQEVATLVNETKPAGVHEVQFDAGSLASGFYYYQLKAGAFVGTKKLLLLR
jgi:photosystem II stability/assembly factor-like uncharacterized protein